MLLLQGSGANLEGVSLELMLLDWDRVTKNEVKALTMIHDKGGEINILHSYPGHWSIRIRRPSMHWHRTEPLEGGVQFTTTTNRRMA